MEKVIQFVANYDDWVAIKKLKIEPGTDPRAVMEFLASLGTGIDGKVEANLGKIVALGKLDSVLAEIPSGKGEQEMAHVLRELKGRNVSAVINEITAIEQLQKNEKKELQDFCRAYATRKKLKECGLEIDYSGIAVPGMKRMGKAKPEQPGGQGKV